MVTWCEMHFEGIQNLQAAALQEPHTIVNWREMRIVKCRGEGSGVNDGLPATGSF